MADNIGRYDGNRNPNANANANMRRTPNKRPQKPNKQPIYNNVFIMFFLPVVLIIVGIAVFLIIKTVGSGDGGIKAGSSDDYIYVLPISERASGDKTSGKNNPFENGGESSIALTGIIYNPNGTSTAVIQTSEKSYVVSVGAEIGSTGWSVVSITSDTVIIEKNGKQTTLTVASGGDGKISISTGG